MGVDVAAIRTSSGNCKSVSGFSRVRESGTVAKTVFVDFDCCAQRSRSVLPCSHCRHLLHRRRTARLLLAHRVPSPRRPAENGQRCGRDHVRRRALHRRPGYHLRAVQLVCLHCPYTIARSERRFSRYHRRHFRRPSAHWLFLFTIPAMAMALTVSPGTALLVGALYGVYHLIENYFIVPKVYGDRLRLSTLTVLISCLAAGMLAGVIGVIIVLPLVASYPVLERWWLRPHLEPDTVEKHVAIDTQEHGAS